MRIFFVQRREGVSENTPKNFIKEEYPLVSSGKGSLTVEAAFVLPIFLSAMLVFLYFMRMVQGYEWIQEGLTVTARAASQYGILEKRRFYQYMEERKGQLIYIEDGKEGISLQGSFIVPGTEQIVVKAEYKVRLPIPFFAGEGITIHQMVKSRVFSGVGVWKRKAAGEEERVYITKYGTVYHRYKDCSFLNPSIQMVGKEEVFRKRNKKGGKYYPCESCIKKKEAMESALYITKEGECFHSSLGCKGINRTIYEIPLSRAVGLRACDKCGG
ncbi:hypothetical protein ASU35_09910 [Acetivibrio ethanolgignens]|uniref:Pilus assembly protein n=1 Tax=Acetivibrio ethanolgignens TaxID=290052 RepID=A0A0V8QFI2_9FIRM|nr:hypothetical protein ASU35_09910 [Acetivibrio ethanolgignens]